MQQALPHSPVLGECNCKSLHSLLMPSILPTPPDTDPGCFRCDKRPCIIYTSHWWRHLPSTAPPPRNRSKSATDLHVKVQTLCTVSTATPANNHQTLCTVSTATPANNHQTLCTVSNATPANNHQTLCTVSTATPASNHQTLCTVSTATPANNHQTLCTVFTATPANNLNT